MKITGCNLGNLIYTQSSYGNLMKANVNFIEISIQFYFIQQELNKNKQKKDKLF